MIRDMKEQNHMIGTKTKICWNKKVKEQKLKEQNHMIGRNKKQNMLEQTPREQKHMIGMEQKQYNVGTTYVTA
jgi:hypothetical protein